MSRRKKHADLDKHLEWAAKLRQLKAISLALSNDVAGYFPLQGPEYRAANAIFKAAQALSSPMENALVRQLGVAAFDQVGGIYYGGGSDGAAERYGAHLLRDRRLQRGGV